MIVDERFAVRTAREVVSAAKPPPAGELEALVHEMKEDALTAQDLVVDAFLLDQDRSDEVRARLAAGSVLVLDQVGWIKANAESLNGMVDVSALPAEPGPASRRAAAAEVAGVLSLLDTRARAVRSLRPRDRSADVRRPLDPHRRGGHEGHPQGLPHVGGAA